MERLQLKAEVFIRLRALAPPVYVSVDHKVYLFNGNDSKYVSVKVKAAQDSLVDTAQLKLPSGWHSY